MSTDGNNAWLREQIAFAIWNSSNPTHIREHITLKNVELDPEVTTALGAGWTAIQNLGVDWRLNRRSFLKLADVAIRAFEAADLDGSAYKEPTP